MRNVRIILTVVILLGCQGLSAQHFIGIRGGYGGGTARFTPNEETGFHWGLASGGISYKFYGNPRFVGAVEADLMFRQNGFKYFLTSDRDTSYHRTVSSIELPLMWQPHVTFFNDRAKFFLNLGVNFYYHLDDSKEWHQNKAGVKFDEKDYDFGITRDNRFGYGLCGGAGLSYMAGRLEFAAEMRYNFGYSDLVKSRSKNKDNKWTRSPVDNLSGYLAVYYRLGRDTTAPPRVKQTRAEKAELRRAQKAFNESIPR